MTFITFIADIFKYMHFECALFKHGAPSAKIGPKLRSQLQHLTPKSIRNVHTYNKDEKDPLISMTFSTGPQKISWQPWSVNHLLPKVRHITRQHKGHKYRQILICSCQYVMGA